MTPAQWRLLAAEIWENDMDNTWLAKIISRGERTARKVKR